MQLVVFHFLIDIYTIDLTFALFIIVYTFWLPLATLVCTYSMCITWITQNVLYRFVTNVCTFSKKRGQSNYILEPDWVWINFQISAQHKNYWTDFHKGFCVFWSYIMEQMLTFWERTKPYLDTESGYRSVAKMEVTQKQ